MSEDKQATQQLLEKTIESLLIVAKSNTNAVILANMILAHYQVNV